MIAILPVQISQELQYLLVVVGLFILPRIIQRFRIPSAITCLLIGGVLGMGFHLFHGDSTIPVLALLGIVSLFLFAGLEVDFEELREGARITTWHIVLQLVLLVGGAAIAMKVFGLDVRSAALLALALFTPSAGFILSSLAAFGLSKQQQFWVKTKTIATELMALLALFFVVQSKSFSSFGIATLALIAMIAVLPYAFRIFAKRILPHAPKSEFAFLICLALICSFITRKLGVYYLVGAFVVGVTAVRLRKQLPELTTERLMIGIELFASFFIPFYFFKAGLHLEREYFTMESIGLGFLFVAILVPLRICTVAFFRKIALQESFRNGARVGMSLVPTLVFTIVIADILHVSYGLADYIYGALLVYAVTNTLLPGLILRTPALDFDTPEFPDEPVDIDMDSAPALPALSQSSGH